MERTRLRPLVWQHWLPVLCTGTFLDRERQSGAFGDHDERSIWRCPHLWALLEDTTGSGPEQIANMASKMTKIPLVGVRATQEGRGSQGARRPHVHEACHLHQEEERARQTWLTPRLCTSSCETQFDREEAHLSQVIQAVKGERCNPEFGRARCLHPRGHGSQRDGGSWPEAVTHSERSMLLAHKSRPFSGSSAVEPSARSLWNDQSLNA